MLVFEFFGVAGSFGSTSGSQHWMQEALCSLGPRRPTAPSRKSPPIRKEKTARSWGGSQSFLKLSYIYALSCLLCHQCGYDVKLAEGGASTETGTQQSGKRASQSQQFNFAEVKSQGNSAERVRFSLRIPRMNRSLRNDNKISRQ